jgi:hypothetical protein
VRQACQPHRGSRSAAVQERLALLEMRAVEAQINGEGTSPSQAFALLLLFWTRDSLRNEIADSEPRRYPSRQDETQVPRFPLLCVSAPCKGTFLRWSGPGAAGARQQKAASETESGTEPNTATFPHESVWWNNPPPFAFFSFVFCCCRVYSRRGKKHRNVLIERGALQEPPYPAMGEECPLLPTEDNEAQKDAGSTRAEWADGAPWREAPPG